MAAPTPVAIVGAGPYGISLASQLRHRNVSFRIFGQPMRFWLDMPSNLFLKSLGFATTIANPDGLTFDTWCRERGLEDREPCSMESFAEYGLWLQKRLVPEVEAKEVALIEQSNGRFLLTLAGGERVEAESVVVAVGLRYYERIPEQLAQLPRETVSHTAHHRGYGKLRGKDVCVVGAGQSALEAAALLHELGARPVVVVRGDGPVFHGKTPRERPLLDRLLEPLTVLGASRTSWLLQHFPWAMRWVPERKRVSFARKYLGPAGAWWLRERFEGKVPVIPRCEIASARAENGRVVLRLREQGRLERELRVDHVVAGTGFEIDVDRLPFLDPDLRSRLARIERAPRVDRHFQSSVPRLYFVGVTTMFDFGPLVRFVAGTSSCTPIVARHLARVLQRAQPAALTLQRS
jgi:cation diffusion facilitator CzcD-associated flavoprotein CzcO